MGAVYFGDLKNAAVIKQGLVGDDRSTNLDGTAADMILGDGNNCAAILTVVSYDIASGDETYAVAISESTDNSTFTAVTGLDGANFTTKTSAGGDPGTAYVQVLNFIRTKRYVRASLTVAGATPSWNGSVLFCEPLKISGSGAGYQA